MSERKVLTGRIYKHLDTTWCERAGSFDEAVAALADRRASGPAHAAPDEIIEVEVVRRARVRTEITSVEEVDAISRGDAS